MTDDLKPCPFCGHTPDPENYIDSIHPITRDGHVWEAGCLANEGGCDAFILGDSREDVIKRWNTRAKDVQKAINDEKQNPWKAAIINELIVDCIYSKEHESDPRKALAEAIEWNVKVALDPTVSKEARDMQQAAIDAALESVKQKIYNRGEVSMKAGLPAGAGFYAAIDIIETAVGTNPLAERDAMIVELEREPERNC